MVASPADENTDGQAREIREHLCSPGRESARGSAPSSQRTFCARWTVDRSTDDAGVLTTIGERFGLADDLERARTGDARDAFHLAVSGIRVPGGWTISRWARQWLHSIWPEGGHARAAGNLHVLVLLTCPHPSRGQPPLPEGAELLTIPTATEGDLTEGADDAIDGLWPTASPAEEVFLRCGLLDMASGRYADLDAATDTLANRLSLEDVRGGAPVAWESGDKLVEQGRLALEQLGFAPGSLAWHPPNSMSEMELLGALWAEGLWQPPAQTWFEGLTARGWAALGHGDSAPVVEGAVVETVRRCLAVERLGRQILRRWLATRRAAPKVHAALWDVPPLSRRRGSLAEEIYIPAIRGRDASVPSDTALVDAASFGQVVQLLQLVEGDGVRRNVADCLWPLVDARNRAAHGRCPSLAEFCGTVNNAARAVRDLRPLMT